MVEYRAGEMYGMSVMRGLHTQQTKALAPPITRELFYFDIPAVNTTTLHSRQSMNVYFIRYKTPLQPPLFENILEMNSLSIQTLLPASTLYK